MILHSFAGAAALSLIALTAPGAQTFVAFGLTNATLGNAIYGLNPYRTPAILNLGSNGTDGVSIHLGEADSGVFVYPSTDSDPRTGSFMAGKLYGSVNGETNRLICSMRAHEEHDGFHPVQIDFTPLGPAHLTFQLFRGRQLVGQTGPQEGAMVVYGNYFNPYYPRVNPFWRMQDGSVGALIEFDSPAEMSLPELGDVSGDRVFIRADNPTNVVNFASRLDVTGGGGLEWFVIYDTRLGVFHRSHKTLGDTLAEAQDGTLTLSHAGTNRTGPGVVVELNVASRFDVTFKPFELKTNASFTLTGIGIGTSSGETLGVVRMARTEDSLTITAELDIAPTNTEAVVYKNGQEMGRFTGTNASLPATARLMGCDFRARTLEGQAGIGMRLDQVVTVVLANQMACQGDEIRFVGASPAKFLALESVALDSAELSAFTIIAEAEEPLILPRLNLVRSGTQIEFTWFDPNRAFALEVANKLGCCSLPCFHPSGAAPAYAGDLARSVVEIDTEEPGNWFYRLSTTPIPPEE